MFSIVTKITSSTCHIMQYYEHNVLSNHFVKECYINLQANQMFSAKIEGLSVFFHALVSYSEEVV